MQQVFLQLDIQTSLALVDAGGNNCAQQKPQDVYRLTCEHIFVYSTVEVTELIVLRIWPTIS